MTNTPSSPADLKLTLEGVCAELAVQAGRKGPMAALARAFLGLLETLLRILTDFRAGKLTAPAASGAHARPRMQGETCSMDAAGSRVPAAEERARPARRRTGGACAKRAGCTGRARPLYRAKGERARAADGDAMLACDHGVSALLWQTEESPAPG